MSGFEAWNEFNKRFRMILDSEISFSPPPRAPSVNSACAHCGWAPGKPSKSPHGREEPLVHLQTAPR